MTEVRHITFIRHGKTPGNERKAYIGITDEKLSTDGQELIKNRVYPPADIVFSSPLARCIETAEIIYPGMKPVIVQDLRETDFGLFEGKNYQELADNPEYQRWIDSGGTEAFPKGESPAAANERFLRGFQEVLKNIGDAEDISIVAHGGTIMAVLSHYFGGDFYSYMTENGEGYTFDLSHDSIFSGLRPGSFTR
ncbi:histidine phosphatase family protein [Pseudobutyrivibrio xylanivorans]|uniref:Histidine phosphatase family protein n=1 Tax=Pseudobutyrivibrio xylanivorans TaxID=185007 RepID=A0A5P6VW27_PSEXY|nr:histidine phosphatase family protein [Pseudobutyrivibrio xylanivorans]QFJ55841.1 histidine phosphatase family protein [Pseudobutyrivibrio xylanivorans]